MRSNAASTRIPLQTGAAALSVFQQAIAEGHGDEDFSAVSNPIIAGTRQPNP